jgi:hypothetical protein
MGRPVRPTRTRSGGFPGARPDKPAEKALHRRVFVMMATVVTVAEQLIDRGGIDSLTP